MKDEIICIRWNFGLFVIVMLCVCGCASERAKQKGILGLSDPALATKQDIEDVKKLINERFDRLEKEKKL